MDLLKGVVPKMQRNKKIPSPYGHLWDNYSWTKHNRANVIVRHIVKN